MYSLELASAFEECDGTGDAVLDAQPKSLERPRDSDDLALEGGLCGSVW